MIFNIRLKLCLLCPKCHPQLLLILRMQTHPSSTQGLELLMIYSFLISSASLLCWGLLDST